MDEKKAEALSTIGQLAVAIEKINSAFYQDKVLKENLITEISKKILEKLKDI